jgi:DNA-binding protein YbaB
MFDKMKQIMEMKKQAERIKRELDAVMVEVSEVPGITVSISGSQQFKSVAISDAYFQEGRKDKLEADMLRCVNAAVARSQQVAAAKMKEVMPGMPGF